MSVTVTCVDDAPVAVDDAETLAEDDPATAVDVLANDTDVDAGPKSIQSVTQPDHGTVLITGGGTGLTYEPNANYCNDGTPTDDFTYTLAPGGDVASVAVTVTCSDDPPVAVNDSATVAEDDSATAIDVLANDTDADGGPKTVQSVTQPANGAVVITGGGSGLTYAPNNNYCNSPPGTTPDTFTYTLNGGDTATVSVTVTCSDDAPVAVNDSATVGEDSGPSPVDVLANDTDVGRRSEERPVGDPARQRLGRDHRRRDGRQLHAERELLRRTRHVHLHGQRWVDGDRVDDRHLCTGRTGAQHGRRRPGVLHRERPGDAGRPRAHPHRRRRRRDDHRRNRSDHRQLRRAAGRPGDERHASGHHGLADR